MWPPRWPSEGIDWPDVPGLADVLAAGGLAADPAPAPVTAAEPTAVSAAPPATGDETAAIDTETAALPLALDAAGSETMWDRVARDPVGNSLAIVVLLGMVVALVVALARLWQTGLTFAGWPDWKAWAVAALCVVGLGVSAYMAYVETTETAAVCGPVGDCNTVQQSEYASLFGVLPIGVLGMVGYGAAVAQLGGRPLGRGRLAPDVGGGAAGAGACWVRCSRST